MSPPRWSFLVMLLLAAVLTSCERKERDDVEVTIAAAASLRRVVPALIDAYRKDHPNVRIRAAFGASGDLRKRVVDGAPMDAVMLANAEPVDDLIADGHVSADTRAVVARNDLVLIGPREGTILLTWTTLQSLPADEKLAIGEPATVPAGQYAKEALEQLGSWDSLQDRIVYGGDVAAVLAYARRGEVAAAVVYATEVIGIEDVVVLDRAKGSWAPAPEVVVGLVATGRYGHQASQFLRFVGSDAGRDILVAHGFGAP